MCIKIDVFVRILRQKQYEEERDREFQLALDREAVRPVYQSIYPFIFSLSIGRLRQRGNVRNSK